ncbi:hypothetical protein BU17DRAFT_27801, partial [Hysterangium stoloniferum]
LKGKTPYELLFICQVDAIFFRHFGCLAYTHAPKDQHGGRFCPHASKCILLG